MARYNVRDIFKHFVKPRSMRGEPCPHACCRGYRVHPGNLPAYVKPRVLRQLSQDDLASFYVKHADCDKCRQQTEREFDRRERVAAARKATGQRNRERARERYAEVDRAWLAAEAGINGYMLNARGRAMGISDKSLFTGSEERAMRYASEDLKRWWEDHPRPTAASMSGNYQVRRAAHARSDIGREASKTVRMRNGRTATVTVTKRKAA